MITENLSTLKIHKLSQEQFEREREAGRLDSTALYLTPDENSSAIIDVTELPTENINEDAFYRLLSGSLVINQVVQNAYTCHCVEALPDTGLPATNLDQTEGHIYFTVGDGELYGYVDSILSMGLGVPSGWYPAATLLGALGFGYSGVITNIMDDPKDNTFRLLLKYVIYSYKDSWTSHKTIGWAGTGPSSEIFNDPMNIASGEKSHAEGNSTTAEGYSSHAEGDFSHAEGYSSHAEGHSSHAEGHGNYLLYYITGEANATTYSLTSTNNLQYLIIGASVRNTVYIDDVQTYSTAKIVSIDKNNLTITLNRTLSEDTALNNTQVLIYYSGMALGDNSHSEGNQTIAAGRSQHTQGEFNVVDPQYDVNNNNNKRAKYAHIVGNGTSHTARSNAHTLDWDGNAWFAGDVYVGSDSGVNRDSGSKKLATEEFVNTSIANLVDSAPDTLNTLNELAIAIQENDNVIDTLNAAITNKVTVPQNAVAGDLLTYDGTNWVRISRANLIADIIAALPRAEEATF